MIDSFEKWTGAMKCLVLFRLIRCQQLENEELDAIVLNSVSECLSVNLPATWDNIRSVEMKYENQ